MKIVVNTSGSIEGGALTHLRNVLPEMSGLRGEDEIVVLGSSAVREAISPPRELAWVDVPVDFRNLPRRLLWENTRLARVLAEIGADVLFHPSNVAVYRAGVPQVNLIHNLAPFLPEIVAEEGRYQNARLRLIRSLTVDSLRRTRSTIFVSQWGRERVAKAAGTRASAYPVIYFGSDHAAVPSQPDVLQRYGLEAGRFILSVSHFYRYKRLAELVDAYARLGRQAENIPLVLAGRHYDEEYTAVVRSRAEGSPGRVLFPGAVGPAEVATLMQSCLVFAFTSAAENLPITLLEAMRAGAMIVTSRACSMPEVCGDAVLYTEKPDAAGYARALEMALGDADLRSAYRAKAIARGEEFRWQDTAARTLKVLREAARAV